MKTNQILLLFVVFFLILTTIRETGIYDFNVYKATFNSVSNANTNREHVVSFVSSDSEAQPHLDNNNLSILVLMGKDTIYRELNGTVPVVVTIDSLDTSNLWMPLYKSGEFTAVGSYGTDQDQMTAAASPSGIIRSGGYGRLTVMGNVLINGVCSYRAANVYIKKYVAERFAGQLKKHYNAGSSSMILSY